MADFIAHFFNNSCPAHREVQTTPELIDILFLCLNIIKGINDKASLKVRRKKIGWNEDYLFNAITSQV